MFRCLRWGSRVGRRLFPTLLPRKRRCALASTRQQTEPFLGPECHGFYDHRAAAESKSGYNGGTVSGSVESGDAGVRWPVAVIMSRVFDADGGGRGSSIGIWWDERTELGTLVMRIEFVVNLFSNEFYRTASAS